MIGVQGRPYVGFDAKLDLSALPHLHEEIARALATSHFVAPCQGREPSWGTAQADLYNPAYLCVDKAERELSPEQRRWYETRNPKEKILYLKFAKGAYFPWSTAYCFNENPSWDDKHDTQNPLTTEAQTLFAQTIAWIQALPFFQGVGRISLFGTDPCQHVTCHADQLARDYQRDDEFICFSPLPGRRAYIYDEVARTKHFVEQQVYTFHDCDYHGVDPLPYFNYCIRVDGAFTAEWRDYLGPRR